MRTIAENLDDHVHAGPGDFALEVLRMFQNCRRYNGPGHFTDVANAVEVPSVRLCLQVLFCFVLFIFFLLPIRPNPFPLLHPRDGTARV